MNLYKMAFKLALVLSTFVFGSNAIPQELEFKINSYYCSKELSCRKHEMQLNGDWIPKQIKHIMCNNGKYGAKCQHAQCMPMTKELKEEFLNGHNEKRSMYATGQGAGIFYQRTASRMATLVWDDELEMIALQNSAKCKMEYDHCHRTKRFEFVGQNLYAIWGYPKFLSVEDAVRSSIEAWYDEHKLIAGVVCINEFGNAKCQSDKIRHFTQMIWDDASHIGCAVVKTASTYYITCNYSYGNMVNRPVYKVGRTGSKCISGLNLRYPGLCNEREFDPYPPHDEPPVAEWKRNGKRCGINANRKSELFQ